MSDMSEDKSGDKFAVMGDIPEPLDVPSYKPRKGRPAPGDPDVQVNTDDPRIRLGVVWDELRQTVVNMEFKPSEFRNWDFVVAVLEVALGQARFQQNLGRMKALHAIELQELQRQAMAQQTGQRLHEVIRGKS